jgi:hypothetical protein
MTFDGVKTSIQAGTYARRSMKSNRNGDGWLFLKVVDGQSFLFVVHLNQETGEGKESPATLDWNDLGATDWMVYGSESETTADTLMRTGSLLN